MHAAKCNGSKVHMQGKPNWTANGRAGDNYLAECAWILSYAKLPDEVHEEDHVDLVGTAVATHFKTVDW